VLTSPLFARRSDHRTAGNALAKSWAMASAATRGRGSAYSVFGGSVCRVAIASLQKRTIAFKDTPSACVNGPQGAIVALAPIDQALVTKSRTSCRHRPRGTRPLTVLLNPANSWKPFWRDDKVTSISPRTTAL